jgi:predicted enzyme related to lactoylglutathione lyase
MSANHGTFAWYDLMTPDASASKKFYPAVTGWSIEPWGTTGYEMWTISKGNAIGGIAPISPDQRALGMPAHWLGSVNVDDVDSAASKVRSLGGKVVHGPEEIPDVGRYAVIEDPQGAQIALFKSSDPYPGWDGTPSVGRFTWHELMAIDARRAFDFYRQLFGWEIIEEMDMGPEAGMYLEYGKNGKMYGGIFNRRPEHGNMTPYWTFYANVKDLNKAVDAVKKGGGTIIMGPMEVPGGSTVAMGKDPQGAMFALHQSAPAARAKTGAKKSAKKAAKKSAKKAAKKSGKKAARKSARKAAKKKSAARRAKPRAKAKKKSRRR